MRKAARRQISIVWLMTVVCVVLVMTVLTRPVHAEGEVGSFTLHYQVPNASFSIYQVAVKEKDGTFTLTDSFANYAVEINSLDEDGMRDAANTLAAYVARDQLKPMDTQKTDADGYLTWSNLEAGMYLVVGESTAYQGNTYTPAPVLLYMPATDENGSPLYALTAEVKYTITVPDDQTQDYTVYKIWKDNDYSGRPDRITVQLLQDGKVYSSCVLDESNHWKYKWKQLPTGHTYQVTEQKVPSGYTVAATQQGTAFVLTNTRPGKPTTPGTSSNIPQTGQLWWPVMMLSVAGLLCLLIGIWRRTRETKK